MTGTAPTAAGAPIEPTGGRGVFVPKHVLKSLDLTTLLVALDHLDNYGPAAVAPDPNAAPADCECVTHIGGVRAAGDDRLFAPFVRDLASVDRKYWTVQASNGQGLPGEG